MWASKGPLEPRLFPLARERPGLFFDENLLVKQKSQPPVPTHIAPYNGLSISLKTAPAGPNSSRPSLTMREVASCISEALVADVAAFLKSGWRRATTAAR